jgi:hypothetical protein
MVYLKTVFLKGREKINLILAGDLCNILITSARKTLGSNSGKNHKEKQFLSKPWFDLDCKFAKLIWLLICSKVPSSIFS